MFSYFFLGVDCLLITELDPVVTVTLLHWDLVSKMSLGDMNKALGLDQHMTIAGDLWGGQEKAGGIDTGEGQSRTHNQARAPGTEYDLLAPFKKADAENVCIVTILKCTLIWLILSRSVWSPLSTLGLFPARTPLVRLSRACDLG